MLGLFDVIDDATLTFAYACLLFVELHQLPREIAVSQAPANSGSGRQIHSRTASRIRTQMFLKPQRVTIGSWRSETLI
jgi:hypothetical protein